MNKITPILSVSLFLVSAGAFATEPSIFDELQTQREPPTTRELAAPLPPNGTPVSPNEEPSEPPMSGEPPVAPPPPNEIPPFLIPTPPPSSEGRAINISIGSNGGELDMSVIRTVRQVIGHAMAQGTLGTIVDTGNREDVPIPVEGGYSVCTEMTFSPSFGDGNSDGWVKLDSEFANFYSDLKSIHPRLESTFYNVEWASECPVTIEDFPDIIIPPPVDDTNPDDGVVCTEDVMFCPDGSSVVREPPSCEFQACPK